MWKVVTGMLAAVGVLALGGAAMANDPAMPETGTNTTDVEQQSGTQNESAFDAKSLKGEQAMKLQQKLKEQGLYHGQVDGKIGPLTEQALRKFQEQKGFGASGKLDQQTAEALGLEVNDIQPVSGSDTNTDTSTQPAESPTPMTNSGSTESDTGIDKAGQSGESSSTTTKDAGELEKQSGDDTKTSTDVKSGSDDSATTSDDMTNEGSGDPRRFPQEGNGTGTQSGSDDTATQPQSGTDGTIDDQTEPQSGSDSSDVGTQSGTGSSDSASTGANDQATGTGSTNSDVDSTTADPDREPQSGNDAGAGMNDDSTSPVTGGGTETEATSPDTGDTIGNGQPATTGGVQTDNDSNVVDSSEIEPQAGTSSTFDKKTIKQVEVALKAKKLFNGKADGVLDDQTSQAIRAFQSQQGLSVTGKLDAKTLSALGVKSNANVNQNQNGTEGTTLPGAPDEMATPATNATPNPNETPVSTPIEPTNPTDPGSMTPH